MKKLWIAGLAICLSLALLASCDFLKHEHIALEWRFTESSHWRNSKCTWNICDVNPVVEDHIDENNDNTCDVCGYVYELTLTHTDHEKVWHSNEYAHWYGYLCGCPSPDIAEEHIDGNKDGVCDVCGYTSVEQTQGSVTSLTFTTVDYSDGGYTQTYIFDFEKNEVRYAGYLAGEDEEPTYTTIKTFMPSEGDTLIDKLYAFGFFDIEERYTTTDVICDGGGWELIVCFGDKTTKRSTGVNSAPTTVFNNCAKAFYEFCGYGVVAYVSA